MTRTQKIVSDDWEAEAIEHMAVWAAEVGDTVLEARCDNALAGNECEYALLDWAKEHDRLALHMERGLNLGWMSRLEVSRG